MSATATALQEQARLIDLRRREAECYFCGYGPTDGKELRMDDPAPDLVPPRMICRDCHTHPEQDFTDLPVVWSPIKDAAR